MSMASRFWIVTCKQDGGGEFTNGSEVFNTFDAVVDDVFSGQIEDVYRVVFIDLLTQASRDVTRDVLTALAARSVKQECEPSQHLRNMLDGYDLPFHDDETADAEARAYDRQVRQDYVSHVRGW